MVLLTLDCPRRRVSTALKLAGLSRLRDVSRGLQRVEMLQISHLRRLTATPKAPMPALRRRLNAVVRGLKAPLGEDADLLLLVAFAGGLQTASTADHLNARHRIVDLGGHERSHLFEAMLEHTGSASAAELSVRLLPGRVSTRPGDLDPGINSAVYGGGHGGGTVGGAQ